MENLDPTVFELGESVALRRAVSVFRPGNWTLVGSGDDAAVVQTAGKFVVTTDTMVEGRDFRHEFSSGFDLGFKAVASNFADVVAMGATPTALVAALVVTKTTKQSWLEDFARGLQAGIDELAPGAEVVGGDLAQGTEVVIAITAHGELAGEPILRSGARPGHLVAVAGTLGKAACGLDLLLSPDPSLAKAHDQFVAVQLRPSPPLKTGLLARDTASAMLDVSDSLSQDATRLAAASGVSIKLNSNLMFGYFAVLEQAAQSMTSRGFEASEKEWVLHGGEDHALLATFPSDVQIPVGFKVIGEVLEQSEFPLYLDDAALESRGWDSVSS